MKMDWNKNWQTEMKLWHASSGKACDGFWADKKSAEIFAKQHIEQHRERLEKTLASLEIRPGMNVLDIGSGPGNLAIPIAKTADSVTCVEPSPGMNEVLADAIDQEGLANIIQVAKSWETVSADELRPPYDLVVASLSLGMKDIRSAVRKMNQICTGQVALFWHGGIPEWEDMPRALWPDLFNRPYHGGPKGDALFMVLYEMGIYPDVRVFSNHFCEIFNSMDEAVTFYAKRFEQLEDGHRPALEAYLDDHCQWTNRGLVHEFKHIIMKFSWKVADLPEACREGLNGAVK